MSWCDKEELLGYLSNDKLDNDDNKSHFLTLNECQTLSYYISSSQQPNEFSSMTLIPVFQIRSLSLEKLNNILKVTYF